MIYTFSFTNVINLFTDTFVTNGKTLPFYGSVQDANNYFQFRLYTEDWFNQELNKQIAALADATRRIDCLNFIGEKCDPNQLLEFPRKQKVDTWRACRQPATYITQSSVPNVIVQATYELALMMLSGVVPDTEADNLSTVTRGYGAAKTEYARTFVPPYIRAGIPSSTAWNLIFPYLRAEGAIKLSRV